MSKIGQSLTSMEVSQMVGKDHSKLLRDIRKYSEQLAEAKIGLGNFFSESTYLDSNNQSRPCYLVTKKGCEFIAHKLTGQKGTEFTARYINRFHEMEDTISAPQLPPLTIQQQIQTIAKGTAELYEKVAAIDAKAESVKDELEAFKQELPLFPEDADEVRAALNQKVVDYLGGDSNAYHDRGLRQKAFIDAYRELKRNFGVSTYKSIKRNQKKRALEVIEAYKPPVILLDEIQMVNSQISLDLEGGASRC